MRKVDVVEEYTVLGSNGKAYNTQGNPFGTRDAAATAIKALPVGTYRVVYTEAFVVSQPAESADGTAIVAGSGGEIVDADGVEWTINAKKQIAVDGVVDTSTGGQGGVVRLEYHDHTVWQQTASGKWWGWVGKAWTPPAGTTTAPGKPAGAPGAPGAPTASKAEQEAALKKAADDKAAAEKAEKEAAAKAAH